MKPTGVQILAEFLECAKDVLNDRSALEHTLEQAIVESGAGLVGINSHSYEPVGITSIAVISESHVAIHTYPEARHASVDIFTCSRSNEVPLKILRMLKKRLEPTTTRVAEVTRGNPIEVTNTNWITDDSQCGGFDIRYHIDRQIFHTVTDYQDVNIIENESFGRMLFLDNDLQIAEFDADLYNRRMVDPLVEAGISLERVAILGGGDGGVVSEMLRHDPQHVTLIDIDAGVIDACRQHLRCVCHDAFEDPRVEVINADVFEILDGQHRFNGIIYDLTMRPEAFIAIDREEFVAGLFDKVRRSLLPGGVIAVQCCSEFDQETYQMTARLLADFFGEVRFTKEYIPSYCTSWFFASAVRP